MLCGAAHRRDIDDQVVLEPAEVVRNARQGVLGVGGEQGDYCACSCSESSASSSCSSSCSSESSASSSCSSQNSASSRFSSRLPSDTSASSHRRSLRPQADPRRVRPGQAGTVRRHLSSRRRGDTCPPIAHKCLGTRTAAHVLLWRKDGTGLWRKAFRGGASALSFPFLAVSDRGWRRCIAGSAGPGQRSGTP